MKTKFFTLLLAIATGIGSMFASNTKVNGIWYDFDSSTSTAVVTYRGSSYSSFSNEYSGNVVIPESVTYNSTTYSVTSIGDYAFLGCSSLTSVTIPNSVKSIGRQAFDGCYSLTTVTIPNSVTSIGGGAFLNCISLTSVTIPNSVTSIGNEAFSSCSGLTSVTIPNSVTSIGDGAFWGCSGLTSPLYNAHIFAFMPTSYSGAYTIPDGIESIAGSAFYGCTGLTSVTIPNSVTSIGSQAFDGCTGLTSVTIPKSVTSIEYRAFSGCTGLTSVTIPNSVTSIGEWAFYRCSGLTSVTIPNSVTSIGGGAFESCTGLTSVTIPNSVTSIGGGAFESCSGLTSVTIPNSVTSIGGGAFYGCTGLTSVTIPNSVTSIGKSAFSGCTGLNSVVWNAKNCDNFNSYNNTPFYDIRSQITSFTFGNEVEHIPAYLCYGMSNLDSVEISNSVTSIGGEAFERCISLSKVKITDITAWCSIAFSGGMYSNPLFYAHYLYLNGELVRDLVIPNSVTSIGNYAFYGWTGLYSVKIGNSVTSIGDRAFSGCAGLKFVTIGNSVTAIGDYAFSGCTDLHWVTIGNNVTSIGSSAFDGCTELTSIMIEAEIPPSLGSSAFDNTYNCPIYVPNKSKNNYVNQWSSYSSRIFAYYTILFKNWDGTLLQSQKVKSGEIPHYTGATPTRPDDEQNSYTFSGWSPQIVAATADTTYTAQFTTTYTIVFKNWDGTVLQSKKVINGQTPQYTGETPTRPYDEQYSYTFSGWSPKIVAATADATYTAQFRAEEFTCNDVQATWLQTGGSGLGSMKTTNSEVWSYNSQYGAVGKKQGGATGWLLTPTKDLRGMKSVTLSFSHTHKFATNYTNEMTLWVCDNYKGDVDASTWKQLTISPYASNSNWTFVNVNINVPLDYVGKKTVFGFQYVSTASNYATWEIKNLQLVAECAGTTPPDTLGHADVTTVSEVTATPNEDNSVTLTWPAVNGAETYTIEIKKNGDLICTLVFNANGQLISMNFAAPARDGKGRNTPAAEQSANGWEYVITGLEGNASYTYSFTAMGTNGNVLLNQSVNFSTGSSQGIDDVQGDNAQCTKLLRNGQIFILRGEKTYTLQGQEVK